MALCRTGWPGEGEGMGEEGKGRSWDSPPACVRHCRRLAVVCTCAHAGRRLPPAAHTPRTQSPDPRPFGSAARYEPVSNRTDTSSHAPSFGDWQDSSAAASAASAAASAASAALPVPAAAGGAQRTSSLLETLLGRKLAEPTPGVAGSPGQPGAMAGAAAADAAAQPGSARPFTLDPPVQLHTAGSGGMGPGGLGALGGLGG